MVKVVILCGGRGTRLQEQTEFRPKPLVEIGGKPILWHIMKLFSHYGYKDFVLCLGYKGEMIKQYFMNYRWLGNDFTLSTGSGSLKVHGDNEDEDWEITFADTGLETSTGGRIKAIQKYIHDDYFLCTYGDGVAPVNISELVAYHKNHGKLATLTAVHPFSKYGVIEAGNDNKIFSFIEKPLMESWVNGGFFVLNNEIFKYIKEDKPFEQFALPQVSRECQLMMYNFDGKWFCMDTYKDYLELEKLWKEGAPWKIWK